jgi:hypothetical protein
MTMVLFPLPPLAQIDIFILPPLGLPYIVTIWIAFKGQARTQSPQPWQREGCGIGIW